MSRISTIRERSKLNEEIYTKRVNRICDAVTEYMQSDTAKLTVAAHLAKDSEAAEEDLNQFTKDISEAIASAVSDPIAEFEDMCRIKGFNDNQIIEIVDAFAKVFMLSGTEDYRTKEYKVAEFLQKNSALYDSMGLNTNNS